MAEFQIIEARRHHCGMMARAMRSDMREAMSRTGEHPHRELRECLDQSAFARAWLIDGRLAGLGGMFGTISNAAGMIWLALTDEAMRHPIAVAREARRQIDGLMETKRLLQICVMEGDEPALRLALFLGFEFVGWSSPTGSKSFRKLLARATPQMGLPTVRVGHTIMVPMEYRQEAA